jgi:hypothetical protein
LLVMELLYSLCIKSVLQVSNPPNEVDGSNLVRSNIYNTEFGYLILIIACSTSIFFRFMCKIDMPLSRIIYDILDN